MNEKAEEPQEQASDRAPMPDEELGKILEAHRMWVDSEAKEGARANLIEANLQEADLVGAELEKADLIAANLQEADLRGAQGLTASQIKAAKNWRMAFYSYDFLKELGLPPDHNERVKKKLAEMEKEKKATGSK